MIEIRQESQKDYEEVYRVVKTAFETAEHSDGNEQDLVVYHYSIVLGSENYYPKFGYIPAIQYGIQAPFDVANENFMAVKLNDTDIEIKGVVQYAKEFGI